MHDISGATPCMHRVLSDCSRTSVGVESDMSRRRVGGEWVAIRCWGKELCTDTVNFRFLMAGSRRPVADDGVVLGWFSFNTDHRKPTIRDNLYRARPVFGAGCEPGVTGSGSPNGNNGGIGCPKIVFRVLVCDEKIAYFLASIRVGRTKMWEFCP